jgi:hypothetical protein
MVGVGCGVPDVRPPPVPVEVVAELPPPPPPPAPVDPCSVPEGALECLNLRVAAAPSGCTAEACVERCALQPDDPACPTAVESLRATCDRPKNTKGADGRACRALSWQLPAEQRPDVLWRGCDANDPGSCLLLAELVADGAPLPKAARGDVRWLRDQACDLQLAYACAAHAW